MTALNEVGALAQVALRPPALAFRSDAEISRSWRALGFTAPPDLALAVEQYACFEALLRASGTRIVHLAPDEGLTLDAIYVRDASVVVPRGTVLGRMGKPARASEPEAQGRALAACGVPVVGAIAAPGRLEGGDVVWFDDRTVAVGHGYRTNAEGIGQFRALAGIEVDVVVVPLPHHRGPADVFHLMSMISPVDEDLAVVYAPLLPVPFRQWLLERGVRLVEVPDEEFASLGANVLALGPRRCLMLAGNPLMRSRLEAAGAEVMVYEGSEISSKGGGGPTCLTRPLRRAPTSGGERLGGSRLMA